MDQVNLLLTKKEARKFLRCVKHNTLQKDALKKLGHCYLMFGERKIFILLKRS